MTDKELKKSRHYIKKRFEKRRYMYKLYENLQAEADVYKKGQLLEKLWIKKQQTGVNNDHAYSRKPKKETQTDHSYAQKPKADVSKQA